MDIDSASRKKQGSDDLEEYNLDEYDKEAKAPGMMIVQIYQFVMTYHSYRCGRIQQYQRPDLLQR